MLCVVFDQVCDNVRTTREAVIGEVFGTVRLFKEVRALRDEDVGLGCDDNVMVLLLLLLLLLLLQAVKCRVEQYFRSMYDSVIQDCCNSLWNELSRVGDSVSTAQLPSHAEGIVQVCGPGGVVGVYDGILTSVCVPRITCPGCCCNCIGRVRATCQRSSSRRRFVRLKVLAGR